MERTRASETVKKIGKTVKVSGFVNTIRDHGKITFVDLRDASAIIQCVGTDLPKVTLESVVEVTGKVEKRPKELVNESLKTGEVEVRIGTLRVLSQAKEQIPIPVAGEGYDIEEELRLKYRYLDLRRERLQKNLRIRSDYVQAAREYLFGQSFVEIETPLLTKSTPEGARDFVVPSRIYKGKFYALPQAPQQYKQLLMVSGFERYFQIARALRDEDPRADRGFEHTQIDIEMAFVEREEVMAIIEEMTTFALKKIGAKVSRKPFPVFTYKEAIKKFGSDRFDLRSKKEKENNILSFAWVVDFPFFKKTKGGGWAFTHNPFSAPIDQKHEKLLLEGKNIEKIVTSQYDLVANGLEVSGGSIRAHKPEVLKAVFGILGHKEKEIEKKFGHMLEAFSYGAPPHGGCAQGFERILMAYLGEEYLREVQAFPMTGRGRTSVMDAPSELDNEQLRELGLKVVKK